MTSLPPLPVYDDAALAALPTEELLELLARDEDRVPRNLIDECVRRGDAFVPHLEHMLQNHSWQDNESDGQWWRLLHAAMILGAIPTQAAGLLLASHMRAMSINENDNLEQWLASHWASLFRNKPPSVLSEVRAIVEDRTLDWYVRSTAIDAMLAMEQQLGPQALEDALDRLATAAQDEHDEQDFCLFCANALLDYPRPRHRALLEALAEAQDGQKFGAIFLMDDVTKAYDATQDGLPLHTRRHDPWQFYDPQAIIQRQERWAREDREAMERAARESEKKDRDAVTYGQNGTYVRDSPKIGRNDPCPCGSGKKYKKCCLHSDAAT
jgi:hypothetical protein